MTQKRKDSLTVFEVRDCHVPDVIQENKVNAPPGVAFEVRVTAPGGACVAVNGKRSATLWSYAAHDGRLVTCRIHQQGGRYNTAQIKRTIIMLSVHLPAR